MICEAVKQASSIIFISVEVEFFIKYYSTFKISSSERFLIISSHHLHISPLKFPSEPPSLVSPWQLQRHLGNQQYLAHVYVFAGSVRAESGATGAVTVTCGNLRGEEDVRGMMSEERSKSDVYAEDGHGYRR